LTGPRLPTAAASDELAGRAHEAAGAWRTNAIGGGGAAGDLILRRAAGSAGDGNGDGVIADA
jgi:hypothetical protein